MRGLSILSLLLLIGMSSARGQHIVVEFDGGPGAVFDVVGGITHVQSDSPAGEVRFRATLVHDSSSIDVTDVVVWQTSDPTVYTSLGGGGYLAMAPGRSEIWATFGDLSSDPVSLCVFSHVSFHGPQDPTPPAPVPSDAIRDAAAQLIDALHDYEIVASDDLRAAHDRVRYEDNESTRGGVLNRSVLAPGVNDGIWLRGDTWYTRLQDANGAIESYLFIVVGEHIVLQHHIAEELTSGRGLFKDHDGKLHSHSAVLLEEILHSVFHGLGLDDVSEDDEEFAIQQVIMTINDMIEVRRILDLQPPNEFNLWELGRALDRIRLQMETIIDLLGEESARRFLESLGLEDADENGLPDGLDRWLRDSGIDEEDLPQDRPGGGGGGLELEKPCPGDQELMPGEEEHPFSCPGSGQT